MEPHVSQQKEQRAPDKAGWWRNVQQGKQVPYAFARSFQLTTDVAIRAADRPGTQQYRDRSRALCERRDRQDTYQPYLLQTSRTQQVAGHHKGTPIWTGLI
jgi:hypothetical protein